MLRHVVSQKGVNVSEESALKMEAVNSLQNLGSYVPDYKAPYLRRLRMFEDRALRRVSATKREDGGS